MNATDNDGPADERCDECGRWADVCRLDPCIPEDDEDTA